MPRRTLLCILDWGLGHAARSLALLNHSLLAGDSVVIATSGSALSFVRRVRPDVEVVELPSYDVRYPTANMAWNVAVQLPNWWRVARKESRVVRRLVRERRIERIVSDNRFGCFAAGVPSVFLTHQLHPITGFPPANWLYRSYLSRFDEFWVPDYPDRRLSGALSDDRAYDNVRYVGPLSLLRPVETAAIDLDSLTILSGPEPMRTQLEDRLLPILQSLPGSHHLVRGLPAGGGLDATGPVGISPFVSGPDLARLIGRARTVICRSGYSTLMDLAAVDFRGRLLLIPTPGQTEQFFLARTQVQKPGVFNPGWEGAVIEQGEVSGTVLSKRLSG